MISELDIWRAANLLIRQHGADAELEAAQRADLVVDWIRRALQAPPILIPEISSAGGARVCRARVRHVASQHPPEGARSATGIRQLLASQIGEIDRGRGLSHGLLADHRFKSVIDAGSFGGHPSASSPLPAFLLMPRKA
jgi:hypothetical protein